MTKRAQILLIEDDQAVVLPEEYRFSTDEVYIRRDATTGDVVLSTRPNSWDGFFALYGTGAEPDDFMTKMDRGLTIYSRDPFDDK
jgi:antitoxin VapB